MAARRAMTDTSTYAAACGAALEQALDRAPFYAAWRALDPGPAASLDARFAALPALAKRDLRAQMPKGFVPRDRDYAAALADGTVELVSTSGTTEERSSVVWHQPWWDASERAAAALHAGLAEVVRPAPGPREAVLTTPLCAGNLCHVGELPMEARTLGRLLFLNQQPHPGRWTPADCDRMLDELARFQPVLLDADPAYLAALVDHAAARGRPLPAPRFVQLTYEFPTRGHLRRIRRSLPVTPIFSSYGSTETGYVFVQCERGCWHQNTATCRVDVQPLRAAHGGPSRGRLLVTALRHPWLALLRFDVGDLVRLAETPCPCGRTAGLTLSAIEGRLRDLTFTPDGRAVTVAALDAAVGAPEGLRAYQLEQTTRDTYLWHFVAEHEAAAADLARVVPAALAGLYGPAARIGARRETAIAAELSGKYRLARTAFAWDPAALFGTQGGVP